MQMPDGLGSVVLGCGAQSRAMSAMSNNGFTPDPIPSAAATVTLTGWVYQPLAVGGGRLGVTVTVGSWVSTMTLLHWPAAAAWARVGTKACPPRSRLPAASW